MILYLQAQVLALFILWFHIAHRVRRNDRHMLTLESALLALDAATTAQADTVNEVAQTVAHVATSFQALKDQLAKAGATPAQLDAIQADLDKLTASTAALGAVRSTLSTLAADPANPVPVPAPEAPPAA